MNGILYPLGYNISRLGNSVGGMNATWSAGGLCTYNVYDRIGYKITTIELMKNIGILFTRDIESFKYSVTYRYWADKKKLKIFANISTISLKTKNQIYSSARVHKPVNTLPYNTHRLHFNCKL